MKRILLTAILIFVIFGLLGAFSANAQTDLKGSYIYKVKEGEISYGFTLKFEGKDAVYYSYEGDGYGTLKGKWSVENGSVTVVIPKDDSTLMFKFKQEGVDLVVTEALSHSIVDAGAVFKKDVSKPSGPDLTAEEVGKRILSLITSIRTLKDISPENIERHMKIKPVYYKEYRNNYGFGGNISGARDWTYGLIAYPYPTKDDKITDTLRFSFNYQLNEPTHPEMPKVFQIFNLKNFSKELQTAGFSAPKPRFGEHGRLLGWEFTRGIVRINVSAKGSASGKSNLEPNEDNYIEMIIVSF